MARPVKAVSWKKGTRYAVTARTAYREFQKYDFNPERIIDAAKSKRSPIHDLFNWDDEHCAHLYRLNEARRALVNVRVVFKDDKKQKPRRAIIRVSDARDTEEGESNYADAYTALSDDDTRAFIVNRALQQIESWQDRYSEIKELGAVFRAIDRARAKLKAAVPKTRRKKKATAKR